MIFSRTTRTAATAAQRRAPCYTMTEQEARLCGVTVGKDKQVHRGHFGDEARAVGGSELAESDDLVRVTTGGREEGEGVSLPIRWRPRRPQGSGRGR
jgi:hypothetical protein